MGPSFESFNWQTDENNNIVCTDIPSSDDRDLIIDTLEVMFRYRGDLLSSVKLTSSGFSLTINPEAISSDSFIKAFPKLREKLNLFVPPVVIDTNQELNGYLWRQQGTADDHVIISSSMAEHEAAKRMREIKERLPYERFPDLRMRYLDMPDRGGFVRLEVSGIGRKDFEDGLGVQVTTFKENPKGDPKLSPFVWNETGEKRTRSSAINDPGVAKELAEYIRERGKEKNVMASFKVANGGYEVEVTGISRFDFHDLFKVDVNVPARGTRN